MTESEQIAAFEKETRMIVAYGGDGTLLEKAKTSKRPIIPIRNYARCPKHADLLNEILHGLKEMQLKQSRHCFLQYTAGDATDKGIAELTVKSADPTSALRFNVKINGTIYLENCIADGIIYASELGSHGYWKSITRTIFRGQESVGLGFIAPTYGINNIVLRNTDKVDIEFTRDMPLCFTADKSKQTLSGIKHIAFEQLVDCVTLFGYDIFCCYECRKLRNSTTVNDMYFS